MNQLTLKVTEATTPTQYFRSALTGTILTFADAANLMDLTGRRPATVADLDDEFEPVHVHLLGVKLLAPGAVFLDGQRVYASTDTGYGVEALSTALAYLASEDHATEPDGPLDAYTEENLLAAMDLIYRQYLDDQPYGSRVRLPDDEAQFLRNRAATTRNWTYARIHLKAGTNAHGYVLDQGGHGDYLEPLND